MFYPGESTPLSAYIGDTQLNQALVATGDANGGTQTLWKGKAMKRWFRRRRPIQVTVNVYNPKELDPAEVARQVSKALATGPGGW